MKEEELKRIISKSTVETSDDFINNLMNAIEVQEQTKKVKVWWSFRTILILCSILILLIVGLLHQVIGTDNGLLNSSSIDIPKTPVFLIITFALLYYLNTVIRLNYYNQEKQID
ncbi:hypothetical protein [uncultured Aquimarina sp.]|uniref:hypothetical protein n=1 Tax=uncultured Aquimarina sp. TaxID=575652 RepID=UPI00260FF034|nr:hypothetical protein [uncultured Aquimarina sp.]